MSCLLWFSDRWWLPVREITRWAKEEKLRHCLRDLFVNLLVNLRRPENSKCTFCGEMSCDRNSPSDPRQSKRNRKKYGTLLGGNTAVTFVRMAHGIIA